MKAAAKKKEEEEKKKMLGRPICLQCPHCSNMVEVEAAAPRGRGAALGMGGLLVGEGGR